MLSTAISFAGTQNLFPAHAELPIAGACCKLSQQGRQIRA